MLQVAGDGYKRGRQRLECGELVSWSVRRVEVGNPHGSAQRCKCHTSTIVGCHYVTRVTSYEEDSTRKGGPLGRAWHLLLGAAFGGETHHPWVYPAYGICIPAYVLD